MHAKNSFRMKMNQSLRKCGAMNTQCIFTSRLHNKKIIGQNKILVMSGWWYVAWWFWTFFVLIPLIFIIVIGVLCCAYFGYITVPCVKARYNSGPSKSPDLNNQNQQDNQHMQQQNQQNNLQNQNQFFSNKFPFPATSHVDT